MRHHAMILAGTVVLALSTSSAFASCADEIASLASTASEGGEQQGKISKDGSTAPLQEPAAGATAGTSGGQVSKDGSTMPLSGTGDGPSTDTAMSDQDAQAQQQGGKTAAAASQGSGSGSGELMAALEQARAAEQAGDETGCMKALEKFR
jgi:hypothetical protein